jgi:hypothetical protein
MAFFLGALSILESIIFNLGGFMKKSLVLMVVLFTFSIGAFAQSQVTFPVLGKEIRGIFKSKQKKIRIRNYLLVGK